jgi:raffinose/stachyose/melibiose transport system permease protein
MQMKLIKSEMLKGGLLPALFTSKNKESCMMKKKTKENINLIFFVAPAFIVYFIFKLYPAISGVLYSMTDWNGLNREYKFIGLDNFIKLAGDGDYWKSVWFTCKYVIVMLVAANILALGLAVAIEGRKHARGLLRTIFYMPNMISMIIGGYMWNFIFTKVLYYMADNWGMTVFDRSWVGDQHNAFLAIIIVASWGIVGYLMIIYMAALQGVPAHLKESAALDGANAWQNFWNITFPLIRPALTICIFWTLNSAFQVFDVIFSLTGGGPGRQTQSVAMNIYEEAFKGNIRYGFASAKSTVLFLIVFLITLLQLRVMKNKEEEL